MSDSLRSHESQHARTPCPSPNPRVHLDSRPSSWWCHPAISSSVIPFSSCPQSLQHQSLFQWVNSSHFLYCLAILNVIWTPYIFNTKRVNATYNRKKRKYLNWMKLLPSLNIIQYSNKKANHIDIHWGGAGIGLWFMLYLVLRHAHLFGMSIPMPLFYGFMEVYSLFWYHDPFLSFFFSL